MAATAPIRSALVGLWGGVLLFSSLSGRLDLLLHRAFHPLVAAAGIALLALAPLALRPRDNGGRSPLPWPWLISALVGGAVLLLPPDPSFTALVSGRSQGLGDPPRLSFLLPPEQRSLSEWVRLLRRQPDPSLYEGQAVRVSGFVLPQPDGPPQLARLQVRCCLADATPIGLPVLWPATMQPRPNQWLAIEGRMGTRTLQGEPRTVLIPRRIRPIARPRRPLEP